MEPPCCHTVTDMFSPTAFWKQFPRLCCLIQASPESVAWRSGAEQTQWPRVRPGAPHCSCSTTRPLCQHLVIPALLPSAAPNWPQASLRSTPPAPHRLGPLSEGLESGSRRSRRSEEKQPLPTPVPGKKNVSPEMGTRENLYYYMWVKNTLVFPRGANTHNVQWELLLQVFSSKCGL